jgi:hypothetical protein
MPSFNHPRSQRHRHFAARVFLDLSQTPVFPDVCLGCGQTKPPHLWSPEAGNSPFSGSAGYYGNHDLLPPIQIPVCDLCLDHMPGREHELSSLVASHFMPAVFLLATLFFVAVKMQAAAVLTGIAGIVWFLTATRAVWVLNHATLFDLRVGQDDRLIYYFRDPDYAKEFAQLNEKQEQAKDSAR